MQLDRKQLRDDIHRLYRAEHEALGETGTLDLLDKGRAWDLSATLAEQGVVVFPHAGVADCGHQIATAVHACLDCGADWVVVVSVLHAFTDEMEAARIRVANGGGGQVFRYLRGPMQGNIVDLSYTDATALYASPPPTWVAGALFEWQSTR
jgi:hypothetical protein